MTPRTIDSFGGIYHDAEPVEDPTTEQSADLYNRHSEDTAQMSRTTDKMVVRFATATSGGSITPSAGQSHKGTASGDRPTVTRTGTGLYDITFVASFTDPLGAVENVGFTFSSGRISSLSTAGFVQTTTAANVIHAAVFNAGGTLSDLGGGVTIEVDAK